MDEKTTSIEAAEPLILKEIAQDRQRISKLEQVDPQPLQKDRGEILRALVVASGGRMLALDARKKMNLGKATFSQLLKTLQNDTNLSVLGHAPVGRDLKTDIV